MYHKFRIDNFHLIDSYIRSAKLPRIYHVDVLFSKDTYYYYDTGSDNFGEHTPKVIIRLATRNNVSIYSDSYFDEFIVNMVINKFSFENDKIVCEAGYEEYDIPYKDLFIVLVGKDLYEALRISVK
jgi:deoxyhypusine synthase